MKTRTEKDTMGALEVPESMLWGAQTARAKANFPISNHPIDQELIHALGLIKKAAAVVNQELGLLDTGLAAAIIAGAEEVADGHLDAHFPVDVFQTGSGTSSNMNANEVIANRAIQILGGEVGSKTPVHPNDHVNLGQSSNDVFPSALHIAAATGIERSLRPALREMKEVLEEKAAAFNGIIKTGRTHLQDAVLMTLGQEFSGFAAQVENGERHIGETLPSLLSLPIGGTAIGTGLNTHPEFGRRMAEHLSAYTGVPFQEAGNHFEAQAARDGAVRMSSALKSAALSLMQIADNIRWLGSGPRLGIGELKIPPVQPGSSIMPGKVNPVMAEALIQVGAQVIGNDVAITTGAHFGHFQLNVAQPLIARNLLEQIRLLSNGVSAFTHRLLLSLAPDEAVIAHGVDRSLALVTALVPHIGYDRAAALAKKAEAKNITVFEAATSEGVLPEAKLKEILDPRRHI
jgi:fumarate hydratase, class II